MAVLEIRTLSIVFSKIGDGDEFEGDPDEDEQLWTSNEEVRDAVQAALYDLPWNSRSERIDLSDLEKFLKR